MSRETRRVRQQEFIRTFNRLVGKYAPWQVWCDMVQMYACAIANNVPITPYREKREQIYMDIVNRYQRDELDIFVQLIGQLIHTMDVSVAVEGDYGDFLGELFMDLNLGNNRGGQFFTPYDVCRMMAEVTFDDTIPQKIVEEGYISVNDCACGAGATLIAFAQVCRERGVNYQQDVLFVGQDIDSTTALMCYIQLSLLGCAGYVVIGDTLTDPQVGPVLFGENSPRCWFTPMYFSDRWQARQIVARLRWTGNGHGSIATSVATAPVEAAAGATDANITAKEAPQKPAQEVYTVNVREQETGQMTFIF